MTPEFVAVTTDATADSAIAAIRSLVGQAETVDYVYVVDAERHLIGVLSLYRLMLSPGDTPVTRADRPDDGPRPRLRRPRDRGQPPDRAEPAGDPGRRRRGPPARDHHPGRRRRRPRAGGDRGHRAARRLAAAERAVSAVERRRSSSASGSAGCCCCSSPRPTRAPSCGRSRRARGGRRAQLLHPAPDRHRRQHRQPDGDPDRPGDGPQRGLAAGRRAGSSGRSSGSGWSSAAIMAVVALGRAQLLGVGIERRPRRRGHDPRDLPLVGDRRRRPAADPPPPRGSTRRSCPRR